MWQADNVTEKCGESCKNDPLWNMNHKGTYNGLYVIYPHLEFVVGLLFLEV